jgi:hypothetical protein
MNSYKVKLYGENTASLTVFKYNPDYRGEYIPGYKEPSAEEKEDCNIYRAKSRIRELALCNDWDYFVTLTLDKEKMNRYDLDEYFKQLTKWIKGYNKKYNVKLKYLLIPEQCKDGAWHMHGLMQGLAKESLIPHNKNGYLDLPSYQEKFGWISLERVKSKKRIASYITKYLSKDLIATQIKVCKHSFYHSQKLKGATLIHEGAFPEIPEEMWQNDYVAKQWFDDMDELKAFIEKHETPTANDERGEREECAQGVQDKQAAQENERKENHENKRSNRRIPLGAPNSRAQRVYNFLLSHKPQMVQRIFGQPRYFHHNALTSP